VTRLGVITGLGLEAACWQNAQRPGGEASGALVFVGGADLERTRAGALALIAAGAEALLSFGVAGALDPDLRPGDVVIGALVIGDGAAGSYRTWPTDPAWRNRLADALSGTIKARVGPILGSDRVIASPAEKNSLFAKTKAIAVDMESRAVAEVAASCAVPLAVVRAVGDAQYHTVPEAARSAIAADGRIALGPVLAGLLRRPQDLGLLLRLGLAVRSGRQSLRRIAALGAGALGPV
jgi:hopanoid-associated phosphorylase